MKKKILAVMSMFIILLYGVTSVSANPLVGWLSRTPEYKSKYGKCWYQNVWKGHYADILLESVYDYECSVKVEFVNHKRISDRDFKSVSSTHTKASKSKEVYMLDCKNEYFNNQYVYDWTYFSGGSQKFCFKRRVSGDNRLLEVVL